MLSPSAFYWKKALILVAGGVAISYAMSVVWYVRSIPYIGLSCSFEPFLNKPVDRGYVVPQSITPPQPGDQILQVGQDKMPEKTEPRLWAQVLLVQSLIKLQHEKPVLVNDLSTIGNVTHIRHVRFGELVLVRFLRDPPDGPETSIWCRVDTLPVEELVPSVLWFFLKVGLFFLGALVFWKRPADLSAAQFFVLCLVTLGAYMGGYHWTRIATQPLLLLVFMACGVLLPAVSLHFYLVFPRPKKIFLCRPLGTLLVNYVVPLGFLAAMVYGYSHLRWLRISRAPQGAIENAWVFFRGLILVYLRLAGLWYLASLVCLVHSFRTAQDIIERNQVKWILFGALAALVPIAYTLYLINWQPEHFGAGGATLPMFAASVCFTVAFAISITRYRLMQLDQILTSGMVYFFISSLVGLVYYGVVFAAMMVSRLVVEPRSSPGAPSVTGAVSVSATALVLLLALDLIRNRFKKALDRRFYREKHQLDRTLRRMGQAIEQLVDPPTLARRLLQASAELLNVSRGAVYLREGEPPLYRLAGSLGPPPPLTELSPGCPVVEALERRGAITVPLRPGATLNPAERQVCFLGGGVAHALAHEGRLLALLVLGPKDHGYYGPDDVNLLEAFAQLTALALENADGHRTIEALNRDLRAKIEKISEQQRRILALQSQLTRQTPALPAKMAEGDRVAAEAKSVNGAAEAGKTVILGSSPTVRRLLEMVRKVSATPSAVLIRGESGTGKELLARALHDNSARAGRAYVKVHCAALSPGLLESELFGHVKGAFTGAHRDKVGRFELADSGTLFLDEIGDISLELQTKLLRVLQEKTFERVGSSDPVQVDVRVIAATHQNLEELIAQGRFRSDLYYRLNVIDIYVPPLRERREDIPELAMHFLQLHAQRCGKSVAQIDDDALSALKAYRWPGNIRELENVIERAVTVADGPAVTLEELPSPLVLATHELDMSPGTDWPDCASGPVHESQGVRSEREQRGRHERERLVRALAVARGNKAEAARALGLARSTLVSRLKKYGLS